MRFAIADPPYFGRAVRWYGEGGRGRGKGIGQADQHPEAHVWDTQEKHWELIETLENEYDGYAIAMSVHNLSLYLQKLETIGEIRICVWHKPNGTPSGNRIRNVWEPVIIKTPKTRKTYGTGVHLDDVLTVSSPRIGFPGAKPYEWTKWVIELMGATADDEIHDLFPGSGSVQRYLDELQQIGEDVALWD